MPQYTNTDPVPAWAAPEDIPALTRLWETAFGDSPEEIAPFFRHQFTPETAAVIRQNGAAVSVMYLLPCRMRSAPGYYVYSVATLPEYRGRGFMRLLDAFCCDAATQRGRGFLLLVPAEPSLFGAYAKLGYRTFSGLQRRELPWPEPPRALRAGEPLPAPLSFSAFYALRTRYLARFSHSVRFEDAAERFAYEDFLRQGIICGDASDYFCARLTNAGAAEITETTLSPERLPAYLSPALPDIRRITLRVPGGAPYSMMKMLGGAEPTALPGDRYFSFPLE